MTTPATLVASRHPRTARRLFAMVIFVPLVSAALWPSWSAAQPQQAPRTPRSAAPSDFTGVWAAVITEDWRWRMVTPPKGDYPGVPLNAEGQKAANAWDPAKDIAAGEQCRAYGAAGVMRLPTRLRISWENDTTLKVETDAGTQVRRFVFGEGGSASTSAGSASRGPAYVPSWQGESRAHWETVAEGQGQVAAAPELSGSLKVVTTRMKPGYVRRNGVPYSANATLTEFIDRTDEPNRDVWLVVTSILDDPQYYAQPFMVTTHFKKEPDASKWNPRPCEVTMPVQGDSH